MTDETAKLARSAAFREYTGVVDRWLGYLMGYTFADLWVDPADYVLDFADGRTPENIALEIEKDIKDGWIATRR